jgi:predicted RNase H-like HicB family nuclease
MQASNNLQKFTIYYRKEEEEGGFSGRCIELPAAISQGETLEELKKNMTEAILLVLEDMREEIREKEEEEKNNIITLEVPV